MYRDVKAQLWSSDMAISVLIFLSAFAVVMFIWNYMVIQNTEQAIMKDMESLALSISDQIIRIPGIPEDWNSSNINALGLASGENVLNDSKIEEFLTMDYQRVKSLLGIGSYEFILEIRHLNNTIVRTLSGTEISYGLEPSNARIVVPVERYCILNNKLVRLYITLWTST